MKKINGWLSSKYFYHFKGNPYNQISTIIIFYIFAQKRKNIHQNTVKINC